MSYAVAVAIAGMVIVFVFLAFLSVLMAVITRVLGDRPETRREGEKERADTGTGKGSQAQSPEGGTPPRWVLAAAAAFLDAEERGSASSSAWVSTRATVGDPWIAGRTGGESFDYVRKDAV